MNRADKSRRQIKSCRQIAQKNRADIRNLQIHEELIPTIEEKMEPRAFVDMRSYGGRYLIRCDFQGVYLRSSSVVVFLGQQYE